MKALLIMLLAAATPCLCAAQSTTSPYRPVLKQSVVAQDTVKHESRISSGKADLGLSVYWAGCNVGASSPEGSGSLLTWNEARRQSGGAWRLPTKAEVQELTKRCQCQWTTFRGKKGYRVTGPNGTSIFLPAAGSIVDGSTFGVGTMGYYWTSTASSEEAAHLYFVSGYIDCDDSAQGNGYSVRLVADK